MHTTREIKFECPNCAQRLAIEAGAVGQTVNCPKCARSLVVPPVLSSPPVSADALAVFRNESLAIASLVSGILSLSCFGFIAGVPAIICGHMARHRHRQMPTLYGGQGKAAAGLVMGYLSLLLGAGIILFLIAQGRAAANQSQEHRSSAAPTSASGHVQTADYSPSEPMAEDPITLQQAQSIGLWMPPGCVIDIGRDGIIHPHQTGVIAKDRDNNCYESRPIARHPELKNGFYRSATTVGIPEAPTVFEDSVVTLSLDELRDFVRDASWDEAEPELLLFPAEAALPARRAIQPEYEVLMPEGPNSLTVVNRLQTWIGVGVFSQNVGDGYRYGMVQGVPPHSQVTMGIPNGKFDVFYIRQDKPSSRFRNQTPFVVTGGNSRIQRLLTVTIGSDTGEPPVEEVF